MKLRKFKINLIAVPKVIDNIECLSDLLRCLPFNHARHSCARKVQQRFYIHIVCSQDKLEQNFLFDIHKRSVPLLHHLKIRNNTAKRRELHEHIIRREKKKKKKWEYLCHVGRLQRLLDFGHRFVPVMLCEFDHLRSMVLCRRRITKKDVIRK